MQLLQRMAKCMPGATRQLVAWATSLELLMRRYLFSLCQPLSRLLATRATSLCLRIPQGMVCASLRACCCDSAAQVSEQEVLQSCVWTPQKISALDGVRAKQACTAFLWCHHLHNCMHAGANCGLIKGTGLLLAGLVTGSGRRWDAVHLWRQ